MQNPVISVSNDKPIRIDSQGNWRKVQEWEETEQKPFGYIVGELRKSMSPQEVICTLGVSRGFLYYHYSQYMNKISFLEIKYQRPLPQIIRNWKEQGITMNEIADLTGLGVTTLYNHLRD